MTARSTRRLHFVWALILVAALLAAPFEDAKAQSGDEEPVECPYIHFVQKGETLRIISILYGIRVQEILDVNTLFPPYDLVEWQPICIPHFVFEHIYTKASFNASVFLNKLTLWGEDFPIYSQYSIKIRKRGADVWTFIGFLFIGSDGDFTAYYPLPSDLAKQDYFQVCLKEQDENYTACKTIDNRYISGKRFKWNGVWITIPMR